MDKRMYALMKRAEMMKTAGVISSAKNKAEQWGDEIKKKGSEVGGGAKTVACEVAEDCSEGICTAKNDCEQWGEQVKRDGKAVLKKISSGNDRISALKAVIAKQAMQKSAEGILDTLKGLAVSAKDKAAGYGAKAVDYGAKGYGKVKDTVSAHPDIAATAGGAIAGSAIGTGIGAALGGINGTGAGKGAAKGAIYGAPTGAALAFLVKKLNDIHASQA
jgi:hypothetical protein